MARRRELWESSNHGSRRGARCGLALPAKADDNKLTLTGSATITTDYMFRSISNTDQEPAAQPEFDLTYGMFYAYIWGSNTAFGDNIELDYGVGITPKWKTITFNIAGLYYTYPGATSELNYFELKTGASWTGGHGPLPSTTIGRRIISSSLATPMRSRERSAMRSRKVVELLRAQPQRHGRLPVL